ncbi:MAG TPA: TfoX/Sxy family protein [Candidatus Krumholzibacteria bacterium]|nr:TfoX/Sxy family protein [Candidatus Krumholzibacteria bacterium]
MDPAFARVVEAFARDRQVTTGKMMASVGLKVNGKIFAMMVKGRFVAKLSKDRVEELVRAGVGERFDPRGDGRLMKEWVVLTGAKPPWIELAREAHRFVRGEKT